MLGCVVARAVELPGFCRPDVGQAHGTVGPSGGHPCPVPARRPGRRPPTARRPPAAATRPAIRETSRPSTPSARRSPTRPLPLRGARPAAPGRRRRVPARRAGPSRWVSHTAAPRTTTALPRPVRSGAIRRIAPAASSGYGARPRRAEVSRTSKARGCESGAKLSRSHRSPAQL